MSANHTPTPWEVFDRGELLIIAPDAAWTVAAIGPLPPNEQPINEANAAFIVQAVNAYGPMVEALKACATILYRMMGATLGDDEELDQVLERVEAALSLPRDGEGK